MKQLLAKRQPKTANQNGPTANSDRPLSLDAVAALAKLLQEQQPTFFNLEATELAQGDQLKEEGQQLNKEQANVRPPDLRKFLNRSCGLDAPTTRCKQGENLQQLQAECSQDGGRQESLKRGRSTQTFAMLTELHFTTDEYPPVRKKKRGLQNASYDAALYSF